LRTRYKPPLRFQTLIVLSKKKIEREQERRKENATGTPFNFNPTTQKEKKKTIPLRVCRVKQQLFFKIFLFKNILK
jgi:hypothetical protein